MTVRMSADPPAMHIELETFSIRSYRPEDSASLARVADNPRIAANLRDQFPSPYSEDAARAYIARLSGEAVHNSFALARGDEIIGGIGLHPQDDVHRHSAELGYFVAEPLWGQGIATRAVGAIVDWGFSARGYVRIFAHVFEGNDASARVLIKNGFAAEGRQRKAILKSGRLLDQFVFARLAEDR